MNIQTHLVFTRIKLSLLCGLATLMLAAPSRAQISILDGPSPIEYATNLNTATFTVSAGAKVLVVFYGSRTQGDSPSSDPGVPSLSWNGIALTPAVSQGSTASTWDDNAIYYLNNPPAGTGAITETATPTGVNQVWWMAYTLTGVDTTKALLTGSVGNSSASTINNTVSNIANASWAAYVASGSATGVTLTITESPSGGTLLTNISSASGNATQNMGSLENCPSGNVQFTSTDSSTGQKMVLAEAIFSPIVAGSGAVSQNPPSNVVVFPTQTAMLSGAGIGTPPLTYLWASNGVNLTDGGGVSGSATPTLSISNIVPADAATYTLSVSNSLGGQISSPAVLTVHPFYAPINITLTNFEASGSDWNSTGVWNDGIGSLPASTSAFEAPGSTYEVLPGTLLRTPAEGALAFTNFPGTQLKVDGNGVWVDLPSTTSKQGEIRFKQGVSGGTVYFPLLIMAGGQWDNGNASTVDDIQGNVNIISNTPIYADDSGSTGIRPFQIDAVISGNGSIEYHDSDSTLGGGLNITGSSNTFTGTWNIVTGPLVGGGSNSLGTNTITIGTAGVLETLYNINNPNATLNLNGRMFLHQNDTFGYMSINGLGVPAGVYPYAELAADYPASFPATWTPVFGSTFSNASGSIMIYNTFPGITGQPKSVTNYEGATVTFSGTDFTGTGPLTYQWLFNGTNLSNGGNISGAQSPTLKITVATASQAGTYQLLVINPGGSAPSAPVTLTLTPPLALVPANIVQNNDPNVCQAVVNFTLPAETDNAGVASVVATPPSGSEFPVGATVVTVVLTDVGGNTATNTFTVTVNDTQPPTLTTPNSIVQPVDSGKTYATVNFATSATDNCGVSSVVATPASGSHFPIGTNTVTVVATDIHGNTATAYFTVLVVGPPVITSQPANQTDYEGTTVSFTVGASSPTLLSYQWYEDITKLSDGGRISGSSTATLTISGLTNSDAGFYTVVVTDLAGSTTSEPASLTVVPPTITTNFFYYQGNQSGSPGTNWYGSGVTAYWTNVSGGTASTPTAGTLTVSNISYNFYVLSNNGIQIGNGTGQTLIRPPYTSPTLAVVPFPGDTLIVQTNTMIRFKNVGGSNTFVSGVTIGTPTYSFPGNYGLPGIMLDGGALNNGVTGEAAIIQGSIYAVPGSQSYLLPSDSLNQNPVLRSLIIQAQLSGSGTIALLNGDSEPAGTAFAPQPFTGTSNNFTGEWIVKSGWLQGVGDGTLDGYDSLGTNASVVFEINPLWVPPNGGSSGNFGFSNNPTLGAPGAGGNSYFYNGEAILDLGTNVANCAGTLILTNGGQMWLHGYAIFSSVTIENLKLAPGYYSYAQLVAISPSNNFSPSGLSGSGFLIVQPYNSVLTLPAVITQNPASLDVYPGQTAQFSVAETGTAPFNYQWTSNGVSLTDGGNVSGSKTGTLTLSGVVTAEAASYAVTIGNASGVVVTSAPAALTVSTLAANVPTNIVQGTDPNTCGAVVNFTLPAEMLTNDISSVVATPPSGSEFPVGTTVVTVVATDVAGIKATNTFTVTVNDTQPPTLTTPSIVLQGLDPGQNYATVNYTVSATDNCGVSNVVLTPASGSQFPFGSSTVTAVATDIHGNSSTGYFTVMIIGAPQITVEPASQVNYFGATASFTVAANSPAPLSYQWFWGSAPLTDGGRISGSSTATLTITGLAATDPGAYSVVVSNVAGSVTSTPALLTVTAPQPTTNYFYYQGNQSGSPGTNWYGSGVTAYWTNVFGGTASTPTAGTVNLSNITYNFYVLTNNGVQVGNGTTVTLIRPPYTSPTLAVVPFPGDTLIVQTNTMIRFKNVGGSVTYVPGVTITTPTYSFPGNYGFPGLMLDGGILNCGNTGQANIIQGSIYAVPGTQSYLLPADTLNQNPVLRALIIQAQLTGSGTIALLNGDTEPAGTSTAPQAITGTSNNFTGEWIVKSGWLQGVGDGTSDGYNSLGTNTNVVFHIDPLWTPPSGGSSGSFGFSNNPALGGPGVGGNSYFYNGAAVLDLGSNLANCGGSLVLTNGGQMWLHGYAIFSSVSIENTILADGVYSYSQLVNLSPSNNFSPSGLSGSGYIIVQSYGPVPAVLPPLITQEPASLSLNPGQTAQFTVVDTGAAPMFYQWYINNLPLRDGGTVSGSATATLTLSNISVSDDASYSVSVSNLTGFVALSTPAVLKVSPLVSIVPTNIVQNNDPNVCGAVVNFTLPPETNDVFGISNVVATPPSGSEFPVGTTPVAVVVTDLQGNKATNSFNVTVNDTQPPTISVPGLVVQGLDAGQNYATVSFTVSATDNCSVSNIVSTPPSGSHFSFGNTTVAVVATDIHGNSATAYFTVMVVGVPQIITEPASQTVGAGSNATFTVVASSPAPLSYQWFLNSAKLSDGGAILGSSTATLTIANVSSVDSASFSVVVSNVAGSVTSTPAVLTVTPTGHLAVKATVNITPAAGGSLSISWSQGTLLQATDLAGPWTAIKTAVSPLVVLPTNSATYFKVQVK